MTTKELAQEVRRRTSTPDLEIYYPDVEDAVGKHDTPYSEYLFVEFRPGIVVQELEGNDLFRFVLRDATHKPQLLPNEQVDAIRQKIS